MKKIIIILFLLMNFVIISTSCIKKTKPYRVSFQGKGGFGFDEENYTWCMTKFVSSQDELEKLSNKMNKGFFDESSNNYNSEIALKVRSFDNNFFQFNNLIICVIEAGNSYNYYIDDLVPSENQLIINIKKKKKKGTFTDEAYSYLFIIELNKNFVQDIERLETIIK